MFCSQLTQESRMQPRSMGLKLVVICGLALLMTIPSFFVSGLVEERTQRAAAVTQEISGHVGGPQTFLGPTLAIPYSIPAGSSSDTATYGVYLVFPAQASAAVRTTTEERHRSLFKVPVFQADLQFEASFDLKRLPAFAPPNFQFDWSGTEILVGVSDARGALADATLTTGAQTITLTPAELRESVRIGGSDREPVRLTLLALRLPAS